jgi:hypothetical protein
MERGQLGGQSLRTVAHIVEALDATAELVVRWQGEELDRLVDGAHAALVQATVARLQSGGWVTRVEVSFNHFGDRGRADVLAFDPQNRILAVVEVKSALGDLQDTSGRLDVKVRLGPMLASSVGWERAGCGGARARRGRHADSTTRGRAARGDLRGVLAAWAPGDGLGPLPDPSGSERPALVRSPARFPSRGRYEVRPRAS